MWLSVIGHHKARGRPVGLLIISSAPTHIFLKVNFVKYNDFSSNFTHHPIRIYRKSAAEYAERFIWDGNS